MNLIKTIIAVLLVAGSMARHHHPRRPSMFNPFGFNQLFDLPKRQQHMGRQMREMEKMFEDFTEITTTPVEEPKMEIEIVELPVSTVAALAPVKGNSNNFFLFIWGYSNFLKL